MSIFVALYTKYLWPEATFTSGSLTSWFNTNFIIPGRKLWKNAVRSQALGTNQTSGGLTVFLRVSLMKFASNNWNWLVLLPVNDFSFTYTKWNVETTRTMFNKLAVNLSLSFKNYQNTTLCVYIFQPLNL